jgi:hypothetical protein
MPGLGGLFSGGALGPLLSGGLLGAGEVGNIIEGSKQQSYQNYILNLLKNPQLLAQMAAKIQQPLNNGLIQSVGNQVQGNLASRGLSQAPGIFAATESQALAPFYQQNQSTAMQALIQSLGLPAGTFSQPTNLAPAMQLFMNSLRPNAGTATGIPTQQPVSTGLTFPSTVQPPSNLGDLTGAGDLSQLGQI